MAGEDACGRRGRRPSETQATNESDYNTSRAGARIGSGASPPSLLATESFFKAGEVRKEMEGGNEVSVASGITQFAEGEPKRRNFDTVRVYQPLEGGNGATNGSVVTL